MNLFKTISTAICATFIAGAAMAADVTFDFRGSAANLGPTEQYSQSGFTVDVRSFGGNIHRGGQGLGVTGGPDSNRMGTNSNGSESLQFTFTPTVNLLTGVVLEHGGGRERFTLTTNTGAMQSFNINGNGSNNSLVRLDNLNLVGDVFTFAHTSGSGIRIRSLTVESVPLPAGAALLLGGLAAFGALRRKKA